MGRPCWRRGTWLTKARAMTDLSLPNLSAISLQRSIALLLDLMVGQLRPTMWRRHGAVTLPKWCAPVSCVWILPIYFRFRMSVVWPNYTDWTWCSESPSCVRARSVSNALREDPLSQPPSQVSNLKIHLQKPGMAKEEKRKRPRKCSWHRSLSVSVDRFCPTKGVKNPDNRFIDIS